MRGADGRNGTWSRGPTSRATPVPLSASWPTTSWPVTPRRTLSTCGSIVRPEEEPARGLFARGGRRFEFADKVPEVLGCCAEVWAGAEHGDGRRSADA